MNKQVHQPDDKWLEALRHKVDEAHVPPPADGWTRLESALDAPKKGVVLWPWLVPAAVAAMAILIFLWQGGGTSQDTELLVDGTEVVLVDTIPVDTVQVDATKHIVVTTAVASAQPSANKYSKTQSRSRLANNTPIVVTDSKPKYTEHVVPTASTADTADKEEKKEQPSDTTPSKDAPEDAKQKGVTTTRPARRYTHIPLAKKVKKKRKRTYSVSLLAASGMTSEYSTTDADYAAVFSPMDFNSGEGKIYEIPENALIYRAIPEYEYSHDLPVKFGLGVTISFTERWALETGLTYTRLRSELTDVRDREKITQTIHYLGVPLRLNYTWLVRPRYKWYTAFGVTLERAVDASRGTKTLGVDGIQCGLEGAVGVQYMLTRRLGLFGEIGINHYYDDDSTVETYRDEHQTSVLLNAGLRFEF